MNTASDPLNCGGCLERSDFSREGFDGGAAQIRGRLMLPEFDFPAHPRLYIDLAYTPQLQEDKQVAQDGVADVSLG